MYALPRWQALTQPVRTIFPAEFVEEFYRVRQNAGINNLMLMFITLAPILSSAAVAPGSGS